MKTRLRREFEKLQGEVTLLKSELADLKEQVTIVRPTKYWLFESFRTTYFGLPKQTVATVLDDVEKRLDLLVAHLKLDFVSKSAAPAHFIKMKKRKHTTREETDE
jgi:hypothetical protein